MTRDPADRWSMARVRDFLAGGPAAPLVSQPTARMDSDPAATQVFSRGVPPVGPPTMRPGPPGTAPVAPAANRTRGGLLPALLAVLAVVVIALIGWLAFKAGNGGDGADGKPGTAASPRGGGGGSSSSSSSSAPVTPDPVTADGLENFVEDYLATVTSDPATAWGELTPAFQAASGSFGQYQRFWKGIRTADLVSADPDPDHRRITYTVEYLHTDGAKTSDEVTLQLEGTDGDYLIAGES
jgi:hypothetical protein